MDAVAVRDVTPPMFAFSDEHEALRDMLRSFFADAAAPDPATRWRRLLADLGADAILFDLGAGETGATPIDLAILAEEAGAALFDGPIVPAVLAGILAAVADDAELVAPLRDGAVTIGATAAPADPPAVVVRDPSPLTIDVVAEPVLLAEGARRVIVHGAVDGAPAVALLDTAASGVTCTALSGLDLSQPLARVTAGAVAPVAALLGDDARRFAGTAERIAGLALSAELLGVARYALDGTVSYVGQRVQFGRTIGSFQAIKHRLVDLTALVELARSAVYGAAWGMAGDPDGEQTDVDLAVAAVLAREAALTATKAAVQLHGGIAITWEHWAHRYLRRAHAVVALTGGPARHRRRLADLVDRRDGHDV